MDAPISPELGVLPGARSAHPMAGETQMHSCECDSFCRSGIGLDAVITRRSESFVRRAANFSDRSASGRALGVVSIG
jgi:hypothetical protein